LAARLGWAALGAALVVAPQVLGPYYRSLALAILADVALAVAWAFFSGPTRYLSLATGAFFGAGAYTTAVVLGRLPWPLPVLAAAAVAAAMALLVGTLALRLRGPYFAVFTFGLAELAKHTLIWFETSITGTVGRLLLSPPGPVALYYTVLAVAALAVTTAVALHYGCIAGVNFPDCPFNIAGFNFPSGNDSNLLAFENEYAPFGVDSGLCLGVAATAFNDEGVTLQPCGVSANTVWILDTLDQSFTAAWQHGYIPLINGSDTNFSHPFVLTYPNQSFPTDKPRPQLVVTNLTGFSFQIGNLFGTGADSDQLWGATFGEEK